MNDKTSSQTQQKAERTADAVAGQFEKLANENIARFESWMKELAKAEERSLENAQRAIDESSKLWKESLAYSAKLNGEWRNLALQATRRAAEMMSGSWVS
jgi:hypothetical protein